MLFPLEVVQNLPFPFNGKFVCASKAKVKIFNFKMHKKVSAKYRFHNVVSS